MRILSLIVLISSLTALADSVNNFKTSLPFNSKVISCDTQAYDGRDSYIVTAIVDYPITSAQARIPHSFTVNLTNKFKGSCPRLFMDLEKTIGDIAFNSKNHKEFAELEVIYKNFKEVQPGTDYDDSKCIEGVDYIIMMNFQNVLFDDEGDSKDFILKGKYRQIVKETPGKCY